MRLPFTRAMTSLALFAWAAAALPAVAAPPTAAEAPARAAPAPKPPIPRVPRYPIEQFIGTTDYRGAAFSPDGTKILVSSDASGVFNAWAVPVAGGEAVQLTRSTGDAIFVEGYFPADERFLYASDQGGNELAHVYVRELDGTVRDLTPGDKLRATFLDWAADDRSFFVTTNERDPRHVDLYEIAVDGYARKLLYQDERGLQIGAISPDRRYLALLESTTTSDTDVWLRDATTGELRKLTEGEDANTPQTFSPDGKSLFFTTDRGHEFAHLVRYDLATGERTEVLRPDWDVSYASTSRDGRYLVAGINADARTEVRIFRLPGLEPVPLPELPQADIGSVRFSRDGRRMSFYASTASSPRDLFVHEIGGGAVRRLTRSLNPAIDPAHLVEGRVVRFRSYDGVEIPGILYTPHGTAPGAKLPALVSVHGGPGGQARIGYSDLVQYLVNHGYVVYAINNRGSSGYGKTFFRMDDKKHGEADLKDCVASKRMLVDLGYVDPARIGIIGGSYGGYMVLAALSFAPREFAAGVDLFGISNWVRTLESIPAWWESFRKALYQELGDPATDAERLRRISPLFHAKRIERPLMVLQGANDPRVLKVESDDIVAAVKANGVPVEYIVFPDEGHGFDKRENQAKGYRAVLEFLDRHLAGAKVGTAG